MRGFPRNALRAQKADGKASATIRRYVATISRVHIAACLLSSCSSDAVRLALKKMGRETSARPEQARSLGRKEIKKFVETAGEGLPANRHAPMLRVAYEPLPRRDELVAIVVKAISSARMGRARYSSEESFLSSLARALMTSACTK